MSVPTTVTPLKQSSVNTYGTPDTFVLTYNLVVYGDDVSADAGQWAQLFATRVDTAPETMFQFALGTAFQCTTVATAGQTLVTMIANFTTAIHPLKSGVLTNVLVIQGGNADCVGGASAATVLARFATLIATAVADGWTVILMGMLQSSGNTSQYVAVNAGLKTNFVSYGVAPNGFGDVAGDEILGAANQYASALFFNADQLTLNANGVPRYTDVATVAAKGGLGL